MARRQPTQNIRGATSAAASVFLEPDEIFFGTELNDTLFGSANNDLLIGNGGDDQLIGRDGDDNLEGGFGNDTLWGEFGADTLDGGEGNDQLIGGDLGDNLEGGSGNDTLWGESARDNLGGRDGDDQLIGGDDIDNLNGDDGNDTLWGESGDDYLDGGNGNDQLVGGTDSDYLLGQAGNDTLFGFGGGSDEIDLLNGDSGADVFAIGDFNGVYYQSGDSNDTEDLSFAIIQDFSASEDFIQATGKADDYDLVTGNFTNSDSFSDDGSDTAIYLGDDLIAIAENIAINNYDRFIFTDDFSFEGNFTNAVGSLNQNLLSDGLEDPFLGDVAIP